MPLVPPIVIFITFVGFGMLAAWLLVRAYVMPALTGKPLAEQLRPFVLLHGFRYVGLGFLAGPDVAGEIGPSLAWHLALGDMATAFLAVLTLWVLKGPGLTPLARGMAWAFNLLGFFDLSLGITRSMFMAGDGAGMAGAGPWPYVIVGFYVPTLLVTHLIMFGILVRPAPDMAAASA